MVKLADVFAGDPGDAGYWSGRGTLPAHLMALVLVGMAFLLRLLILPMDGGLHYLTYFPVVTLAAVIGGFMPGLLATLTAALLVMLTADGFSLAHDRLAVDLWSNLVFVTGSLITCYAIETMHRYRFKYAGKLKEAQQQTVQLQHLQRVTERLLQRNQSLMMSVMDGICIMDVQGHIVMANDAFCRMLGYAQGELAKLNVSDWDMQFSAEEWLEKFNGFLGRTSVLETRYRRKDGNLIDIEVSISGVMTEGQGLIYASGRDITARKRAEDAQRVAAVAFETHDAIMITDADGKIVRVNQAYSEITGYQAEQVLGKYPGMINQGQQAVDDCMERLQQSIRDGSWAGEGYDTRKNGEVYPRWMTVTAVKNQQQKITHYVSIFSDVTARKQFEEAKLREVDERFRGTLEQAAVGIVHSTLDGYLKQVNQKFCDIVGYTREELLAMCVNDLTCPDDRDKNVQLVQQLLAGATATFAMEMRYVRKDGTTVWVNLTVSLLRDTDRTPKYMIGVIEDITVRRHLKRQLHDLTAHLQTVREEEKASFAREIHDDLGGTLTALKMDVYWLAEELAAHPDAKSLLEHVNSMSQLLDNAVNVTRRVITDLRPTILDDLGLQAAIEWQAGQFYRRTGIQCQVSCIDAGAGELNKSLSINLFRIFQEALTNIARHSGASRVEVELHHEEHEIILCVRDNGCGLPQGHKAAANSYGMIGMRERVEQLEGRITFDRQSGGGLGVLVVLPLHIQQERKE